MEEVCGASFSTQKTAKFLSEEDEEPESVTACRKDEESDSVSYRKTAEFRIDEFTPLEPDTTRIPFDTEREARIRKHQRRIQRALRRQKHDPAN
jgi:hypothetical protein